MTDRRDGRGRLSSIDLLPEDAEVDIVWALEQLRLREMPQTEILRHFNRRLAEKGLDPIKKSAFNSWSMRKAVQFRRIDETRTITRDIVASIGTGGSEEMTIAVAELVKVTIYELLESREKPDAKATWQATLGDLTDAELAELWSLACRHGETRPLLVIEESSRTAGLGDRMHWCCFDRIEPYERRSLGRTRWAVRFEDWL